ncbi:hypothetical protein [Brevibacterium iodinum]|nr:hypothetical protein [Brevibacterium iodinum]
MSYKPDGGAPDALFDLSAGSSREILNFADDKNFVPVREGNFQPQVVAPEGTIFQGDSTEWLRSLEPTSVDLIFADPPYNIKKADWDNWLFVIESVDR